MPAPAPITNEPNPATPAPAPSDPAPAPAVAVPDAKPVRPEGLGEAFDGYWNDETGVDYAKLSEDFSALRQMQADAESRAAQVPDAAHLDEYEVAMPEGFALPDGLELPEGMTFEALADHPLVPLARDFAQKHGLTKDGFKDLVALQAVGQVMEHKQLAEASAAERVKLGSKATERTNAVVNFYTAKYGAEAVNKNLLPMMFTAGQVELFEKVMADLKASGPKPNGAGREADSKPALTEDQWNAMSHTQRIEYGRKNTAAAS